MNQDQKWTELLTKIYNQPVKKSDALLVHGWGDLHQAMIKLVAQAYQKSQVKIIALNGAHEYEIGQPGFKYWQKELTQKYKIPSEVIKSIGRAEHTGAEAEGFIKLIIQENISSVLLISVPQHIPRAFLNLLAKVNDNNLKTKIFPLSLSKVNWQEKIIIKSLTGGREETTRAKRLADEFSRAIEYRQKYLKGDKSYTIASLDEGFRYLNSL